MKKILLAAVATSVLLSACATKTETPKASEPMVGLANPASVFCLNQGGKSERRTDSNGGEYALCHLPNGQVVEEWEYFRKHAK